MEYAHIKRWSKPDHFADFGDIDRTEYYVALGRTRDSDALTESNFRTLLAQLGGESETVLIIRDSHWAVGWVEAIYIHESDAERLKTTDEALEALDGYPVLDENDYSELQWERATDYWERMSVRERADWCKRYDVSIFAARRPFIPEDPSGGLFSALAE